MKPTVYEFLNNAVQNKINILNDEPNVPEQSCKLLVHYQPARMITALTRIIEENPQFEIYYRIRINCLALFIRRK